MIKRLLLIIFFVSCSKDVDDLGFRTYTIPKGEHSSGTFINHPNNSRIIFDFILDESAVYYTEVPENQHDVNKIYGMSDFGKLHQKYSIRLGWRYIDGEIELCWLRHEEGRHSSETIRTIEPNEIYNAVIDIKTFYYVIVIKIGGTEITILKMLLIKIQIFFFLEGINRMIINNTQQPG